MLTIIDQRDLVQRDDILKQGANWDSNNFSEQSFRGSITKFLVLYTVVVFTWLCLKIFRSVVIFFV